MSNNYIYETHMHTSEVSACATSTAAEQVRFYKEKGYTGIIITDHFVNGYSTIPQDVNWEKKMRHFVSGYDAAKKEGDACGLDVFLGWEYTINGLDFLTYGLDLNFLLDNPEVHTLTIEKYSALVRASGGYIAQAHPYREAWYIERSMPVAWELLDGVEVCNAMDTVTINKKSLDYANAHNLAKQAGSDSHSINHSRYSGIILDHRARDIFDIIDSIKNSNVEIIENSKKE